MTPSLFPRLHIDIGVDDLGFALRRCAANTSLERATHAVLEPFGPQWLATRSVRSAFDLYLAALALPAGSEVIMSALTVPDMWRLVELHGLTPVAVDLDPHTLAATPEALEAVVTERTRLLVVAQLFGARLDLTPWLALSQRLGIPLVEDLAQAFVGPHTRGDARSDLWLFSFGTIKTASALGGGLAWVRDDDVRGRMHARQQTWPIQRAAAYAKKVTTLLGLAAIKGPHRFRAFERACLASGQTIDGALRSATRGFPSDRAGFLEALRQRPAAALLEVLDRRLRTFDSSRITRRADAGERLASKVNAIGAAQSQRTHWLCAVTSPNPDALVTRLREEGFDAARGTSTINVVPGGHTPACTATVEAIVFVPTYPEIPTSERDRLAELIRSA